MKKIILLMLASLAIVSCDSPRVKGRQNVNDGQTVSSGGNNDVKEVEIKGHIYLIFNGYNKGNIIHAEHCPCKTTK